VELVVVMVEEHLKDDGFNMIGYSLVGENEKAL